MTLTLLSDDVLRRQLGDKAAHDARQRFDPERQVDQYLEWYREILEALEAAQGNRHGCD